MWMYTLLLYLSSKLNFYVFSSRSFWIQQRNPWQKKIDDTQIRIQYAQEQLNDADPAYANELKKSIARMNAELEMYYQKASEWQPVQESVFSYMEEQSYKDSKSNSKGCFVDKGYKKPANYYL